MNPRLLLTKMGQRWFRRFPTWENRIFVRNHFRNWCVRDELLTRTSEGFSMLASPHDYVSYTIYFFGSYDPEMTCLLKAHVPEDGVCWDVGTERGWFSLLMGRLVGPQGRVDAFEAFPPSHKKLQANVALNRFTWIRAYNLAVSDSVGRMHFVPPSEEVTRQICSPSDNGGIGYLTQEPQHDSIEVPTTTLDQHAERNGLKRLDFIKMDIEGAEVAALRGAERTIRRFRPKLVVEYNRQAAQRAASSVEELDKLLESYNYDRFTYNGRLEKWRIERWKDYSDNEAVFNVYCFPQTNVDR